MYSFLHLFSWTPSFKNIPLNVPTSNSMPLNQLKQGIQENAGNFSALGILSVKTTSTFRPVFWLSEQGQVREVC